MSQDGSHEHSQNGTLGPILCWAVVFADIGTSIYYVPSILHGVVGALAGFFVMLTLSVFVLLCIKYAEVTHRFPQGGGVVTVAAEAFGRWFGAIGGMFILVDYFLTAAISGLSAIQYLGVVIPAITPVLVTLAITILILVLLGVLNWVGVKDSARISVVAATIAFISDIVILVTVFTHVPLGTFLRLFLEMFSNSHLTGLSLLTGYAGSFLAFSGLESISQLAPVMKTPRKKVAGTAMVIVIVTIGITSPLLTLFATLLLPAAILNDPVLSGQLISLLGGQWGYVWLQTEIAVSATGLLIFASNTAIIGSYHVFIAMAKMGFFPSALEQRNKLRNTPHNSIALATGIPIVVLILAQVLSWLIHLDTLGVLGDMYAFGLLGAFSLTCAGLDMVRYRERKKVYERKKLLSTFQQDVLPTEQGTFKKVSRILFVIGIFTTGLVLLAWCTNLITKPLATGFGLSVTLIGMTIAIRHFRKKYPKGLPRVKTLTLETSLAQQGGLLAVVVNGHESNRAVIEAAIQEARLLNQPLTIGYVSTHRDPPPEFFEIREPFYNSKFAKGLFSYAKQIGQGLEIHFVYTQLRAAHAITHLWSELHPNEVIYSDAIDGVMTHLTTATVQCKISVPRRGTGIRICVAQRTAWFNLKRKQYQFVNR